MFLYSFGCNTDSIFVLFAEKCTLIYRYTSYMVLMLSAVNWHSSDSMILFVWFIVILVFMHNLYPFFLFKFMVVPALHMAFM